MLGEKDDNDNKKQRPDRGDKEDDLSCCLSGTPLEKGYESEMSSCRRKTKDGALCCLLCVDDGNFLILSSRANCTAARRKVVVRFAEKFAAVEMLRSYSEDYRVCLSDAE